MLTITRDGAPVATVADANAAFVWLLQNTNHSTAYAIKYDGYSVTDANGVPVPGFRKEDIRNYSPR